MTTEIPLEVESYPIIGEEKIKSAAKVIQENAPKWDQPFFMDVFKYADTEEFKKICAPFVKDPKLKNLIILGTGGSYQTMKAIDLFANKNVFYLVSSRPHELAEILEKTTPADSLVIPISRAGKTLDVNSILYLFKDYKMLALSSLGPMFDLVKKLNATILPVPDLSGRFAASVCSVALVPALLCGIDIEEFQKGLDAGYKFFKDLDNIKHNYALRYAAFLNELYPRGYRNIFSMPYSLWLEGLVGLFVQEISESSGKEGNGFLGTYQAAPLCQHSVLELILGGSKGHTTPLLWTTIQEPSDVDLKSFEKQLEGQTGLSVINYQLDATFQALLEQGVPSSKISLKSVSPYTMGFAIAFVQTIVYYYCLLTNVDWASNPLVNTGKKICNDALDKKLDAKTLQETRIRVSKEKFANFF
jgi:glucose-6-phosphate isomerase